MGAVDEVFAEVKLSTHPEIFCEDAQDLHHHSAVHPLLESAVDCLVHRNGRSENGDDVDPIGIAFKF
jgi:hypothetical protein